MHIKSDAAMRCWLIKINCNMKLQAERHTHTLTDTHTYIFTRKQRLRSWRNNGKTQPQAKQTPRTLFKWPSYMSIPTAPTLSSLLPRCLQHTNSLAINRTDFYGCCCCDSPDTRSLSLSFVGNGNPCVGVSQH